MYNNKTKHLLGMAKMLVEGFNNQVPADVDLLQALPGVGRKSANVIASVLHKMPVMPVDTHVFRVAKRLGLVDPKTSLEHAHNLLEGLVPTNRVYQFHIMIVEHGRKVCKAQCPRCTVCILQELCPSYELFTR